LDNKNFPDGPTMAGTTVDTKGTENKKMDFVAKEKSAQNILAAAEAHD
jgi:hypothetical protein